jgi:hypothetical protein
VVWRILILVLFSGFQCVAQESALQNPFINLSKSDYYLSLFSSTDSVSSDSDKLGSLILNLEKHRHRSNSDRLFLKHLFMKTHHRILQNYVAYCSFNATLNDGDYNCLTGTAIYAILLTHFNIDFKVIETNYHIFLIANTGEGEILFESTDPINGFVDDSNAILKRTHDYRENKITSVNADNSYHYTFDMYNRVSMEELLGLLYYNYSIDAYNHKDLMRAINYLDKASRFYQSKRIEELSKIILLTVEEGKIKISEKEICLKKITSLRKKMPILVSKNTAKF